MKARIRRISASVDTPISLGSSVSSSSDVCINIQCSPNNHLHHTSSSEHQLHSHLHQHHQQQQPQQQQHHHHHHRHQQQQHHHHHPPQQHGIINNNNPSSKSLDICVPESRIEKMRKLLSSPLLKRRNASQHGSLCSSHHHDHHHQSPCAKQFSLFSTSSTSSSPSSSPALATSSSSMKTFGVSLESLSHHQHPHHQHHQNTLDECYVRDPEQIVVPHQKAAHILGQVCPGCLTSAPSNSSSTGSINESHCTGGDGGGQPNYGGIMMSSEEFNFSISSSIVASPSSGTSSSSTTSSTASSTGVPTNPCLIPFIVTRLCSYIESSGGMAQEGLFRISGNAKLVEKLKHSFDITGDAPLESEGDLASAAALLKQFLRELPQPLIPNSTQFLDVIRSLKNDHETCVLSLKALVSQLPDQNYYTLRYLIRFLHRIAQKNEENRMTSTNLGIVFAPNIFRVCVDTYQGLKDQSSANEVANLLISEYSEIFNETSETGGCGSACGGVGSSREDLSYDSDPSGCPFNIPSCANKFPPPPSSSSDIHQDCLIVTIEHEKSQQQQSQTQLQQQQKKPNIQEKPSSIPSKQQPPSPQHHQQQADSKEILQQKFQLDQKRKKYQNKNHQTIDDFYFDDNTTTTNDGDGNLAFDHHRCQSVDFVRLTAFKKIEPDQSLQEKIQSIHDEKEEEQEQEEGGKTPKIKPFHQRSNSEEMYFSGPEFDPNKGQQLIYRDGSLNKKPIANSNHKQGKHQNFQSHEIIIANSSDSVSTDDNTTTATSTGPTVCSVIFGGHNQLNSGQQQQQQKMVNATCTELTDISTNTTTGTFCQNTSSMKVSMNSDGGIKETRNGSLGSDCTENFNVPTSLSFTSDDDEEEEEEDDEDSLSKSIASKCSDDTSSSSSSSSTTASASSKDDGHRTKVPPTSETTSNILTPMEKTLTGQGKSSKTVNAHLLDQKFWKDNSKNNDFVNESENAGKRDAVSSSNGDDPSRERNLRKRDEKTFEKVPLSLNDPVDCDNNGVNEVVEEESLKKPIDNQPNDEKNHRTKTTVPSTTPTAAIKTIGKSSGPSLSKSVGNRRLQSIRRKLRQFEIDFEQENGFKPLHEHKMESSFARPLMLELGSILRARNLNDQTKQSLKMDENCDNMEPMKSENIELLSHHPTFQESSRKMAKPWKYKSSRQDNLKKSSRVFTSDDIFNVIFGDSSQRNLTKMSEMMDEIQRTLVEKRAVAQRPESLDAMSFEQIFDEKLALQKALLRFEALYGRPSTKPERDVVRPVYDRYRLVKRYANKVAQKRVGKEVGNELQPIIEHVQMDFKSPTHSIGGQALESISDQQSSNSSKQKETGATTTTTTTLPKEMNFHEMSHDELLTYLHEFRQQKRNLRSVLRTFENDFYKKTGRRVEKEDRNNMSTVYSCYKNIKGKIRLIETLVLKFESQLREVYQV